jgi:predicted transcriptional regulator
MYLFAGTRGAEMRMQVVLALAERPSNTNQLAKNLKVDYKAIQYQLNLLTKNKLVQTPDEESYGALYFLTPLMEEHMDYVREIWNKYGKSKINREAKNKES